jgi:hypothetical protein
VPATLRLAEACRRWRTLETLLGTRFFRPVGIVSACPRDDLATMTATAAAAGLPVRVVEPSALPHVRLPAGWTGVLETAAGVLLAERALRAAARWLAGHPEVTLRPSCAVTAVDTDSGRVTLAGGTTLRGDLVLVAAGPWSTELVDVPVVLHRQTMVYLRPPENLSSWWENAPGVGRIGPDGRGWVVPPGDGTVLKISTDAVRREVPAVDFAEAKTWAADVLAAAILSDVDDYTVLAVRDCHYATRADTGGALLTRAGPAVWVRAACGGNGFSSAPLVAGRIVETMMEAAA